MKKSLTKTKFKSALRVARHLITSRLFGSVLISLVLMSGNAWAGTPALQGIVKDATGRPIKGADVRIEARDFSKIVKTDATGHYISDGLAVSTYKVTLVVNGSVKASILNAKTQLGKPTQLNFNLTAKAASVGKHTHSVWCPTETGTLIGGTGQRIEVEDNGNIVSNTGINSVEKVSGSALPTRASRPAPATFGGQ
jgi:carboxypeptidase family protein